MALEIEFGHKRDLVNDTIKYRKLSFKSQFQLPWVMITIVRINFITGEVIHAWVNWIVDPTDWIEKIRYWWNITR